MSIQDVGQSLLANVRERKDQQYEQYKKDQRDAQRTADRKERQEKLLNYGIGFLVDVGNNIVANKTKDFLTSEDQLAKTASIKNANAFAQDYANTEAQIKAYSGTSQDYFAEQALPTVQTLINTKYSVGYNEAEKQAATAALSMKYGKSLYDAHELQRGVYDRLVAGDVNFIEYKKEIADLQPTTMLGALKQKAASLFSKGEDIGYQTARSMGMLDIVDSALDTDDDGIVSAEERGKKAFYNVYRQSKNNIFATHDLLQDLKDAGINISKATPTLGKPTNIYTVNDYGEQRQVSIQEKTINGVSVGWYEVGTGNPFTSQNGESVDVLKEAAVVQLAKVKSIQPQINELINQNDDARDAWSIAMNALIGDASDSTVQKERTEFVERRMFWPITKTAKKLQNTYGVSNRAAMQIAVEMHTLNYGFIAEKGGFFRQKDEVDMSMSLMPDLKWNSQLAAAAVYNIEQDQRWSSYVRVNDSSVGANDGLMTSLLNEPPKDMSLKQVEAFIGDVEEGGKGGFLGQARFRGMPFYSEVTNQIKVQQVKNITQAEESVNTSQRDSVDEVVQYSQDEAKHWFIQHFGASRDYEDAIKATPEQQQALIRATGGDVYLNKRRNRELVHQKAYDWIGNKLLKAKAISELSPTDQLLYRRSEDKDAFLANIYGEKFNG
tara:strand:- start:12942 stop:14936 length:1995 start_codon:yes stop_codon:yes gene_type:complete